jgi:hypothetical protein
VPGDADRALDRDADRATDDGVEIDAVAL